MHALGSAAGHSRIAHIDDQLGNHMGRFNEDTIEATPLLDHSNTTHERESKALYRKLTLLLGPVSFLVTLSCTVSRANVGLAAMDMAKDIGLSKSQIGMVSSLFFVTYMLFQVPSNVILVKVGGPVWLGALIIGWGLASALTAFVRNVIDLYVLRLFLGLFQAGGIPGIQYYLSLFFPEANLPMIYGIALAGAAAGMGFSSPVGAGLLAMDGVWNLHGWQWLFLVEGLPSVFLGICFMLFLPKNPSSRALCCKKYLTPKEIAIVEGDTKSKVEPSKQGNLQAIAISILLNGHLWALLLIMFLFCMARYIAMFWTPLWIGSMLNGSELVWDKDAPGKTANSVEAAMLATIPYSFAAIGGCVTGWTSSKLNDRVYHCSIILTVCGTLFALMPWMLSLHVALGFFSLTMEHIGVNAVAGLSLSLATSFMTAESKAFGVAWLNSCGNLNGVVGPMLIGILADITNSYKVGIVMVGVITAVAGILFLFVKDKVRENSKAKDLETVSDPEA